MTNDELVEKAIDATYAGAQVFIKFLSANDTGETGGHQAGILINKKAMPMIFGETPSELIAKRPINITWQDDLVTESTFTWYNSKHELRLTGGFVRNFPYLNPELTGSLFILICVTHVDYKAYVLSADEDIDEYLLAFSLGPQDSGLMFSPRNITTTTNTQERMAIQSYVRTLGVANGVEFPSTQTISFKAREIQEAIYDRSFLLRTNPDTKLLAYTRIEYEIFREMEHQAYGHRIAYGFASVDDFIELANKVLNRRKSRAGKSLEHHLSAIFQANNLQFEEQVVTEGNKKPDFVFPSGANYHDLSFPTEKLVILAAKTTCKDRWRQILSEADRVKAGPHYLITLQQGNTTRQLEEMQKDNVQLIVPEAYKKAYPPEYRNQIWSLKHFIGFVRERTAE